MREQRITIELGQTAGDPDAEFALRSALAIVQLLESVDKKTWPVGTTRLRWKIVRASKNSPTELVVVGEAIDNDYRLADVVGLFVAEMESLEQSDAVNDRSVFDSRDLKKVEHIGNDTNKRPLPVRIHIPASDDAPARVFVATPTTRRHAKIRRLKMEDKAQQAGSEYVAFEGLLVLIELDQRANRNRRGFDLIERETQSRIRCDFDPRDSEKIGSHIGGRIFVEGDLIRDAEGRKRLEVAAFRLIPKSSISDADLKEYGLATPDGMDAADYIKSLRVEHE